jgi:hypothetical protein
VEASLRAYELAAYFWKGQPRKLSARDEVVVHEGKTTYLLWGHSIAVLQGNDLTIRDCGYETMLTKDRLNNILREISLYSDRGRWFLSYKEKHYRWAGEHVIDLSVTPYVIDPCEERKFNKKLSERLRQLYKEAAAFLEGRETFFFKTYDGGEAAIVFAPWSRHPTKRYLLIFTTENTEEPFKIRGMAGQIHVCRAFKSMKNVDPKYFFQNAGDGLNPSEILSQLIEWGIDLAKFPAGSRIVQAISLAQLVYPTEMEVKK